MPVVCLAPAGDLGFIGLPGQGVEPLELIQKDQAGGDAYGMAEGVCTIEENSFGNGQEQIGFTVEHGIGGFVILCRATLEDRVLLQLETGRHFVKGLRALLLIECPKDGQPIGAPIGTVAEIRRVFSLAPGAVQILLRFEEMLESFLPVDDHLLHISICQLGSIQSLCFFAVDAALQALGSRPDLQRFCQSPV